MLLVEQRGEIKQQCVDKPKIRFNRIMFSHNTYCIWANYQRYSSLENYKLQNIQLRCEANYDSFNQSEENNVRMW